MNAVTACAARSKISTRTPGTNAKEIKPVEFDIPCRAISCAVEREEEGGRGRERGAEGGRQRERKREREREREGRGEGRGGGREGERSEEGWEREGR
eukprot:3348997-Rhodomonas_salina.1